MKREEQDAERHKQEMQDLVRKAIERLAEAARQKRAADRQAKQEKERIQKEVLRAAEEEKARIARQLERRKKDEKTAELAAKAAKAAEVTAKEEAKKKTAFHKRQVEAVERKEKEHAQDKRKAEQTSTQATEAKAGEKQTKAEKKGETQQTQALSKVKESQQKHQKWQGESKQSESELKEAREQEKRAASQLSKQEQAQREKVSKEKMAERIEKEKRAAEVRTKAKEGKAKELEAEKKRRENEEKAQAERKAKDDLRAKQRKERLVKARLRRAERAEEKKKKEDKRVEIAVKESEVKKAKAREVADKQEKTAKAKARAEAKSKELLRKQECKLKKLNREKEIKAAYPKKLSISYRGKWHKPNNGAYAPLALYAKGDVCQLEGTLRKTTDSDIVAKLGDHRCRPSKTMYFPGNYKDKQVAIEIDKAGFVKIGKFQPEWISLSGIIWTRGNYMMEEATALIETSETDQAHPRKARSQWEGAIQPLDIWKEEQPLVAHKHGNLCILAGQLKSTSWLKADRQKQGDRYIAKLPYNCRPSERMIFTTYANPGGRPLRVDILADGHVEAIVNNQPLAPLVNLYGIAFSTVEGTAIELNTGFQPYGGDYMAPQARQENGICHVQGLLKGDMRPRKLATLPIWCRPEKLLEFNAPNNGEYVHQLEVQPDGAVMLVEVSDQDHGHKEAKGWKGVGFISLSGITFPIPYRSAYGAIMSKPCV